MTETKVGFFLERHIPAPEESRRTILQAILKPEVLDILSAKNWGISIAIPGEITDAVVETIRLLNTECPDSCVTAWVTLPKKIGYRTNVFTLPATERTVNSILKTAGEENLRIDAIGFDLEPPVYLMDSMTQSPRRFLSDYLYLFRMKRHIMKSGARPHQRFSDLVETVENQGVGVETYEMPLPPCLVPDLFNLTPEEGLKVDRFGMFYSAILPPIVRRLQPILSLYAVDVMPKLAKRELHPALGVVSGKEGEIARRNLGAPEEIDIVCLTRKEFIADVQRITERGILRDGLYIYALGGKHSLHLLEWTKEALSLARSK